MEFAPGLGITAKMTLAANPAFYTAVERDEAAAATVSSYLSGPNQRCVNGTAEETWLGDEEPDDQPPGDIPVVRLDLSNPSPQVNEEVRLTCSVVGGDAGGVLFDFQPANDRLFINRASGTASFIVEETDIGVEFAVTCTATNETGTSRPSNQQVIIATP